MMDISARELKGHNILILLMMVSPAQDLIVQVSLP